MSVARETVKRAAVTAIRTKFNLATIKVQLIIAGVILVILILIVLIAGIISSISDSGSSSKDFILGFGQAQVSAEVEQYRDIVSSELEKNGRGQYTDLLLALMMQESGGRGNDPMQASESKCGYIGCITSPSESIKYGVKHFLGVLEKANYDVKLTLQSYNFGGGFISYVMKNGGSYTKELAISFSQMMYQKLSHTGIYRCNRASAIQHNACYGDIEYVDAVLKYLPSAVFGNTEIIAGDFNKPVSNAMLLTSPYGWRNIGAGQEFHKGIDLSCSQSDSIHSVKSGKVVYASVLSTYGNLVQVQHDNYITAYAHLSAIHVNVGDEVSGGQSLGMCGNTGRAFGSHLHFEVKIEMWSGQVNPAPFLGL